MQTEKMTRRAVIYCRIDNNDKGTNDLTMQELQCRQYAINNGYEVVKIFLEISDKECWYRDGFQELLNFCLPGNNNGISVLITPNMEVLVENDPLQLTTVIEQMAWRDMEIKVATADQFIMELLSDNNGAAL